MASVKESSNKLSHAVLCPSTYIQEDKPSKLCGFEDDKWCSSRLKGDIYDSQELSLDDVTKLGQLTPSKGKVNSLRNVRLLNLRPHGNKVSAVLAADKSTEHIEACDHVSLMAAPLYAHQYLEQLMQTNYLLESSNAASSCHKDTASRRFSSIAQEHIAQHSDFKKLSTCYGKRTLVHKVSRSESLRTSAEIKKALSGEDSSQASTANKIIAPHACVDQSLKAPFTRPELCSQTDLESANAFYQHHDLIEAAQDHRAACKLAVPSHDLNTARGQTLMAENTKETVSLASQDLSDQHASSVAMYPDNVALHDHSFHHGDDSAFADSADNHQYDFVFMADELELCYINCLYLVSFNEGEAMRPYKPLNTNRTRPMRLTKLQMGLKIPRYTYALCHIDNCSYTFEEVVLGLAIGELYSMFTCLNDYGYLYDQLEDEKVAKRKNLPSALLERFINLKLESATNHINVHDGHKQDDPSIKPKRTKLDVQRAHQPQLDVNRASTPNLDASIAHLPQLDIYQDNQAQLVSNRPTQATIAVHRPGFSIYPLTKANLDNEFSLICRYPYNGRLSLMELQHGARRNVTFSFGKHNEVLISCIPLSKQSYKNYKEHDRSSLDSLASSAYKSPLSLLSIPDRLSKTHYEIELCDGIAIQSQLFSAKAFALQCSKYDRLGLAVTFGALKREHLARRLDNRLLEELKKHLSVSAIAQYIIDTASSKARLNPDILEAIFVKARELNYISKLYGPRGSEYQIALFDDHIEIIKGHYYGLGTKYVSTIHGRYRGVAYTYQSNEFNPLHLLQGKVHVSNIDNKSLILNLIDSEYSVEELHASYKDYKEIGTSLIPLKY